MTSQEWNEIPSPTSPEEQNANGRPEPTPPPNTTPSEMPSPTWSAASRYFILALLSLTAVGLMIAIAPLLRTVGIAVLLALLLNPLVHWLMSRFRLSRSRATMTVFTALLLILVGLSIGMGNLAYTQLANLETDFRAALVELQLWLLQPVDLLGYHLEPATVLENMAGSFSNTLATLPGDSLNLFSTVTTNVLWGIAVFVLLYYFLKDGPQIKPWLLDHVPAEHRSEIGFLWDQVEEIWGKFLRIQLLLFLVLAILFFLGTLLVVWLFRSGLVRWSPVGFVLLLLVVYTAVQQVDNLWLRPQYMGRHLQLHPGIVFVALIVGLLFGGLLGALVIVPAIASARIVGRYLYYKILGLPPWEKPPTPPLTSDG